MYKAKIDAWKINKKLGKKDYLAALQSLKQQGLRKRAADIIVGDRVVPIRKLKRFCRNSNIEFPGDKVKNTMPTTPTIRSIASKPKSPEPALHILTGQEKPARLFSCFERYVNEMFDNGSWKSTGTDEEIEESIFSTEGLMLVEEQYDILWISKELLDEGKGSYRTGQCWNKLFENMNSLLVSTYPTVLRRLIAFVDYFFLLELGDVAKQLHAYIPQMAARILSKDDPKRKMFEALADVDPNREMLKYCSANIAKQFADILADKFGAGSRVAYRRKLDHLRILESGSPSGSLDDRLPPVSEVDRQFGPFSDVAMTLLSTRISLHIKRKENEQVLEVAPQLLFRTDHALRNYRACRFLIQANIHLGIALYELKHFEDSRIRFEKALEENAREQAHHSGHECFYDTHRCMTMLVDIARATNDPISAEEWSRQLGEVHQQFLTTVIQIREHESDSAVEPGLIEQWTQNNMHGVGGDYALPKVRHSLTF